MRNKQLLVIPLCGLLLSPLYLNSGHENDNSGAKAFGIGLAAGAVAGGIAYALTSWLSNPSTKDVCEDAQHALNATRNYGPLLAQLEDNAGATPLGRMTSQENYDFMNANEDDDLELIAKTLYATGLSGDAYITQFAKVIDKLKSIHKQLAKRLRKTKETHKYYETMQSLHRELQDTLDNLMVAHRYLQKHVDYWILFEAVQQVAYNHTKELALAAQYGDNNHASLWRELRSVASMWGNNNRSTYVYSDYAQHLNNNKSNLDRKISKAYRYSELTQRAQEVSNGLHAVYAAIINSNEHAADLREYERAKLELERKRLEEERLRIERERLRAERERRELERQRLAAQVTNLVCGCLSLANCCHHHHHQPTGYVVVEQNYVTPVPTHTTVVETTTTHYQQPQPTGYIVVEEEYCTEE